MSKLFPQLKRSLKDVFGMRIPNYGSNVDGKLFNDFATSGMRT